MPINPVLSTKLNSFPYIKKKNHDEIYQDLQSHANDVQPDETSAKLVKENPFQKTASAIKDNGKDCKNFVQAVRTGRLDDHKLGRINDVGIKLGALLIATFLASRAKTKTQAIMEFVGGTAFIASMSLWPKIFINLPAKLIHGFDIGQKYISTQGNKKDFFLDNQFLPWDAYSKEEISQIGKRMGIDADSENGEEKIKRKMQKTALQNRTLWMATAGVATPIMTSMICRSVEPMIEKGVAKSELKKAQKAINLDLKSIINASPDTTANGSLESLLKDFNGKSITESTSEFWERLEGCLGFDDFKKQYANNDDYTGLIETFRTNARDELIAIQKSTSTINTDKLKETLSTFTIGEDMLTGEAKKMPDATIKSIIESMGEHPTLDKLTEVLKGTKKLTDNQITAIQENLKAKEGAIDNTQFFEQIKNYNGNISNVIKGRMNKLFEILKPTQTTAGDEYKGFMKSIFKKLKLKTKDLKQLGQDNNVESTKEVLVKYFQTIAKEDEAEYTETLRSIIPKQKSPLKTMLEDLEGKLGVLSEGEKLSEHKGLTEKIFGSMGDGKKNPTGVFAKFKNLISQKKVESEALKYKALICGNFERRVLDGTFEKALQNKNLISDKQTKEYWTNIARNIVYNGSASLEEARGGLPLQSAAYGYSDNEKALWKQLKEIIYGTDYTKEANVMPEIKDFVYELVNVDQMGNFKENYTSKDSFAKIIQKQASQLYNNKNWFKTFGLIGLGLVAITIAAQFFFGNIKNEFSDKNNEKGGNK